MNNETHVLSKELMQKELSLQGPGDRLRMAREDAGLIPSDIAKQLRVTTQVINDIEKDDFKAMPKFVFVRGYLRAYARIVHLSADEIIASFNRMNYEEAPSDRPSREFTSQQMFMKEHHVRWFSYIISVVLLLLLGVWWNNHRAANQMDTTQPIFSEQSLPQDQDQALAPLHPRVNANGTETVTLPLPANS